MSDTKYFTADNLKLAYTVSGEGPPLVLIHGWPFHKANFRHLIPLLSESYTCYALDSAGMGESEWSKETDLSFHGHVDRTLAFADHLNLTTYAVLGHDTGGTIARLLAVKDNTRVTSVTSIDTEIPHQFPPTVTLLQKLHRNPLSRLILKAALSSETFVKSGSGYGGFFADPSHFTDEFMQLFVHSWHRTRHAYDGLMAYLCAVDPDVVDTLDQVHADTQVPMLFIWGKRDPIFPVKYAREMVAKIPGDARLVEIDKARFVPHEEQPEAVAEAVMAFLQNAKAAA